MNAAIRFLRCVAPSAALSLALGLGSWQVASAQAPPAGPELLPQGPAVAAPVGPAGPAVAGPIGPAAGPAIAGPIDPAGGPGLVAGDGPIVDAPPPGPALLHHFVFVERFPRYREMVEFRTELLLYADNTFNLIYPDMGHCRYGEAAGPTTIVGAWGLRANRLSLQFDDGFVDYGFMVGPSLRFHGSRWTDLLAPPPVAGPVGPAGPGVAGPIGPGIGPQ